MNEQNAMKPYVIGLDLGGTNSVFGIVDARGEIKATTAIKTGNYPTAEAYVDACMEALPVIIDQVGGIEKIKAMGIGAPTGNYYKGHPLLGKGRCGAPGTDVQRQTGRHPRGADQRRQRSSYR